MVGVSGEGRLQERSEPAHVGAEHRDVPGLEPGSVVGVALLEQVEEGIAQDLDLTGRAIGTMPADAHVVLGVEKRPTVSFEGERLVGPDRVLDALENRRLRARDGDAIGWRDVSLRDLPRLVEQQQVGLARGATPVAHEGMTTGGDQRLFLLGTATDGKPERIGQLLGDVEPSGR